MPTAVSAPADHFPLNLLAEPLSAFQAPSAPFDPRADAELAYGVYTLAGRPGRAGSLRVQRTSAAEDFCALHVRYEKHLPGNARQHVSARMQCRSDIISTPVSWTFTAELSRPSGPALAKTRTQKRGLAIDGRIEIADDAARRRIAVGKAYTINWALFDAVGRLPRKPFEPLQFTMLDHFDQVKRNQRLSYRTTADVRLGGATVRLHAYDHLGEGIVPWVYWVDDPGRLLFAVSGIEAYLWESLS
jgi:hypothetical protein